MAITLDGTTGITAPGVTDTGNLSVAGTSTLTGAVSQTNSSTAASFIPTGSTVPANGMYLSAANTLNLATNTTNQVSISSTGIVTGTAGNLMLVQGTAQASTSGTNIDFTGISSWAKRITVMFNGISASGTSPFIIQIGSGSFVTTGYTSFGINTNTTTLSGAAFTTGLAIINAPAAAISYSGNATLALVSGNAWTFQAQIGSNGAFGMGAGNSPTLSGALDRIRITTVNGTDTFDAGTINIQYE